MPGTKEKSSKEKKVDIAADNGRVKITFSFTHKQIIAVVFFIFTTVFGGGGKSGCYVFDLGKKAKANAVDDKRKALDMADLKAEIATLSKQVNALAGVAVNGGVRGDNGRERLEERFEEIEEEKVEELVMAIKEDSIESAVIYNGLRTEQYAIEDIIEKKPIMKLDFGKGDEIRTLKERLKKLDLDNPDHEREIKEIRERLFKLRDKGG